MIVPLELTGLTKVFPTPTGPFVAVKDVNAADRGRRVRRASSATPAAASRPCCRSSPASSGPPTAASSSTAPRSTEPGAERAVVFQSPCLLPWLTARQNVELAATQGARRRRVARALRAARALSRAGRRRRRRRSAAARSSRSARSSACRWRARCRSSRGSCCSTSRSRSSTR